MWLENLFLYKECVPGITAIAVNPKMSDSQFLSIWNLCSFSPRTLIRVCHFFFHSLCVVIQKSDWTRSEREGLWGTEDGDFWWSVDCCSSSLSSGSGEENQVGRETVWGAYVLMQLHRSVQSWGWWQGARVLVSVEPMTQTWTIAHSFLHIVLPVLFPLFAVFLFTPTRDYWFGPTKRYKEHRNESNSSPDGTPGWVSNLEDSVSKCFHSDTRAEELRDGSLLSHERPRWFRGKVRSSVWPEQGVCLSLGYNEKLLQMGGL
jgi:hypothetical protein